MALHSFAPKIFKQLKGVIIVPSFTPKREAIHQAMLVKMELTNLRTISIGNIAYISATAISYNSNTHPCVHGISDNVSLKRAELLKFPDHSHDCKITALKNRERGR